MNAVSHLSCTSPFIMLTVTLVRIPEEWYDVMHTFYDDYRARVS